MSTLLRTTVERQLLEWFQDAHSVGRAPHEHIEAAVERLMGALGEIGVDEALVSGDHFVEFSYGGWVVQHPLLCRPDMLGCVVNQTMSGQVEGPPPEGEGRYRVRAVEGELEFVPQFEPGEPEGA